MKKSSDVVIHINELLNSERRSNLSENLQKIDGVVSAHSRDATPHLMIVEYQADKTKAYDVLSHVRDTGMHAQLVGWL